MDDIAGITRTIAFSLTGYPIYLARTLIQLGYEPRGPDEYGRLPNMFNYISIIRTQRGYLALYTGLRYYLPASIVKKCSYDLMASVTNHKTESNRSDTSELIAICLRESALRIHSTILAYPITTLCIGYISSNYFGDSEPFEYTLQSLYKGIVPKLIIEVTMVWVSIISRHITACFVQDEVSQMIVSRIPLFIVQSLLYPLSVVSTVMADNGISKMNPKFVDYRKCLRYLQDNNFHKRGSSFFWRRDHQFLFSGQSSIRRYY